MIVFPQGAVLRLASSVSIGQMLVLTNMQSRQDAICRVVKVRTFSNAQGYVEVEFTHQQAGFWGAQVSSDDAAPATKIASAPPVTVNETQPESKARHIPPAPDVSWAPAPPHASPSPKPPSVEAPPIEPKPVSAASMPLSSHKKSAPSFISIGSQEEVQPAASATTSTRAAGPAQSFTEFSASDANKFASVIPFPPAPPAAEPASPSMAKLQDDEPDSVSNRAIAPDFEAEEESSTSALETSDSSRRTFGSFAGGATLVSGHAAPAEEFDARMDSSIAESKAKVDKPPKNWLFVAASIALVVASVAAGVFYFWGRPARNYVPRATSSATPQSAPETMAQATPLNAANLPNPAPMRTGQPANPSSGPAIPVNANPPKASANSPVEGSAPAAPKKQAAPGVTAGMVTDALNAHPVTASRAEPVPYDAAPTLEPDASSVPQGDGLSAIVSSSNNAVPPPPLPAPEGPVRVGGQVKEPRLISSTKPVYPALAQKTAVQGDVVIETTIDKNGSVAKMHVVSGPSLLRDAALNAVRQWKYEPLLLNNQPISVQMMVTVKFRL